MGKNPLIDILDMMFWWRRFSPEALRNVDYLFIVITSGPLVSGVIVLDTV